MLIATLNSVFIHTHYALLTVGLESTINPGLDRIEDICLRKDVVNVVVNNKLSIID